MSPVGPGGERPKPQIEYHKILYKLQVVFPPADVVESRSQMGGKAVYTLPQGQHEYPFSFKIPFNNSCQFNNKAQPMLIGLEPARPPQWHVKKTLPPTLAGFPGEAEIRYFVKVTVNRHSIFKENPRAYTPFNFFPIEPPRKPASGSEIYARQKHKFDSFPGGSATKEKMKSMFSSKSSSAPNSPMSATRPGQDAIISVDARLPEPAILTCNSDIPLRLIVKKLSDFGEALHLQSLQVSLIGHTKVRAHEVFRTETNSWIIMSRSNMGIPIGLPTDTADTEVVLDDKIWRGQPLPNTVAPSFQTCNIERSYQLDIRIGLSYGAGVAKPQNVVLPLRLDVLVYSGIAPPPEVLTRMAEARAGINRKPSTAAALSEKIRVERQDSDFGANQVPLTPLEVGPSFPPRPGNEGLPPEYSEAPPSYEDAIASDAPAVAGTRPQYVPPPHKEDPLLQADEKKGWMS